MSGEPHTVMREAEGGRASIRDYLVIARRRLGVILLSIVLVPALALMFSLRQQTQYEAAADVVLNRQNLANSLTGTPDPGTYSNDPDRLPATQAQVARSPEIARRTLAAVPTLRASVAGFLAASAVEAQAGTDLLTFKVDSRDKAVAERGANEYARQFIGYRRELDTQSLSAAQQAVQRRLRTVSSSSRLHDSLISRMQQLQTLEALQTANAALVRTAMDAKRVRPRPVRNLLIGVIGGIALGVALALLFEALDTRIRDSDEIEGLLRTPVLARLPGPPKRPGRIGLPLLAVPGSRQFEAFQLFRTALSFGLVEHKASVVMVTSAVAGEGKTTTVANLAAAFARSRRHVIVVDFDLHRQTLAPRLGKPSSPGLSEVVLGYTDLDSALQPIDLGATGSQKVASGQSGTLELLASGARPPSTIDLTTFEQFPMLMAALRERADFVIVDTPPLVQVSDALSLTNHVDGIIVVARPSLLRRPALRELDRILKTAPVPMLGFVETGFDMSGRYGYSYGYGYGSESAHTQESEVSVPAAT